MNVVATSGRRRLVEAATGVSFDVVVDVVDANKAEQAQHALGTAAATPAAARGFSALVSDELTKKSIAVSTQATVVRAPTTESKMIKAGCYIKSHSCPNHRWASGKWNLHAHGTKMGKQYCLNDADNHHKSCGGDVMDSWSQKWVDNNGEEVVTYPKPGCYWKLEQCPKKPGWVTTPQNGGSATGWKRHSIDDQARCVGSAWSHHYFCGLSPTQLSSTVFIGNENSRAVHLQSYHTVSCGVQPTQKLMPKAAYLSSVYGRQFSASKCVDGDSSTHRNMCHSKRGEGWLKID